MKHCNTTLIKKQQKLSALSSDKTDKYKYVMGEEILPSDQIHMVNQKKFIYSPIGKAFETQTNNNQQNMLRLWKS